MSRHESNTARNRFLGGDSRKGVMIKYFYPSSLSRLGGRRNRPWLLGRRSCRVGAFILAGARKKIGNLLLVLAPPSRVVEF